MQITDRSKDVIKSGGEWISSVELENQLMGHPDVFEAAVVAVPDERWDERPLACVVLAPGEPWRRRRSCASSSASKVAKWQLPERWAFIEAVPKTSVGKFDKKVLRRQYGDGELDRRGPGLARRGYFFSQAILSPSRSRSGRFFMARANSASSRRNVVTGLPLVLSRAVRVPTPCGNDFRCSVQLR